MNRLEQRIKRLERNAGACNHRLPIILSNPTEGEIQERKSELDNCPRCRWQQRLKIVVLTYSKLNELQD